MIDVNQWMTRVADPNDPFGNIDPSAAEPVPAYLPPPVAPPPMAAPYQDEQYAPAAPSAPVPAVTSQPAQAAAPPVAEPPRTPYQPPADDPVQRALSLLNGPDESGPREATPGSVGASPVQPYGPPLSEAGPEQPDYSYTLADGRTEPPTANGDYRPMRTIPNPQRPPAVPDNQWLAEDSQSTPPPVADYPAVPPGSPYGDQQASSMEPAPGRFAASIQPTETQSALKPVWDAAGTVIGYVQTGAGNLIERVVDPKPIEGRTEADRRIVESVRSVGQPITSSVNEGVASAERAMGAPEGSFLQAAQDASGVLGAEGPVRTFGSVMRSARNARLPDVDTGLRGAMQAPNTGSASGVVDDVLESQRPRALPAPPERIALPEPQYTPFESAGFKRPPQEAAIEEARQRFMQGLPPRDANEQMIVEQFGRRWSDIPPYEQPAPSRQAIGEAARGQERVSAADLAETRAQPDYQPQSISLNATPGVSASAGLVGDLSNAVGGGVAGAAAGGALPAETPEERAQNALRGAAVGMVGGPVAGRLMSRAGGALATPGVSPNRHVASPSQSANPNIRNVARMMGGNYKPVGESRSVGEILSAALTDRWAIHANVPKEARARIIAAGNVPPAERLAERIEVNGPTIAHQRTLEEIGPALRSVGKDDAWVAQVLVHRHNLDIAREVEQSVQRGILSEDLPEVQLTAGQQQRMMLAQRENKLAAAQEQRLTAAVTRAQDALDAARKERDALSAVEGAGPGGPATIATEQANASVQRTSVARAQADMRVARAEGRVQAAQQAADQHLADRQAAIEARRTERAAKSGAEVRAARQFSGGMDEEDSIQALVDIQTEIGPERFRRVMESAEAFWAASRNNLDRKVAEGIVPQELADTLKERYPHYVRTDIADYAEKGPAVPSPGGKSLGISTMGINRISIQGTAKDRVNPIISTIDAIYATESAITRNAAARDLVAVRDADPTFAELFREVAPDVKAYRGNQKTMVPPDYTLANGEEKLTHWNQGAARQFVIPKEYGQLLNPTPGALLGDNAGPLRAFYSLIRGQLTTHNPGMQFVTSPIRDMRDAVVGMQTAAGAAAKRTGASLPENVAREARASIAAFPEAVGRLLQAVPQVAEGFFSNTYGPRVSELRRAGMGFNPRPSPEYRGKLPRWLANPQDTRAAMEDLQRTGGLQVSGKADVARIIRNVLTLYAERVGNRLEMLPRVAAANMERGRGGDLLSQTVTGQNATVSFLKGGWLTHQVNAVDPFLNTTVQSGAQNARLYRKSPAAFTAALITTVGIPALLAEAWNRSDPDRAKAYEDRPEYLKNTGIIWELPSLPQGTGSLGEKMPNFLWEPLGNYGWVAMAAREALGVADKATGLIPPTETPGNDRSDPMYWAKRGVDILAMFSPVKGGDAGSAAASLLPPVVSEEVELVADHDFFRDSPIKTDRADERASNLAKTITTGVNALTGSETRPSEWEHRLQPFGYAGQLARGVSNLGREKDQTRPIQDIPAVGPMASRVIRDSSGQRLQDERVAVVTPAVRQALKDAGLRGDELTLPASNIRDMPITRQEQAAYQRNFNALLDQKVKDALADPDWKTSTTVERERWLKNMATRARTEAGGNVVDTWDESTYDFRTDKRVEKKTGTAP